jgi:hypothetical protein
LAQCRTDGGSRGPLARRDVQLNVVRDSLRHRKSLG